MTQSIQHTRLEKLLLEAARTFNSTLEYEELNELVLKLVTAAVNAEAAMISRIDPDQPGMKTRLMRCADCQMQTIFREPHAGAIGWVIDHREPVIINDASDSRMDRELEKVTGLQLRSLIALPMVGRGRMVGVVKAINKLQGEFTAEDMDILTGLSHQIAVAIDNAALYREARREALEKNLLYESGKLLSRKLALNDVLAAIMESLKQVVNYDAGGVFLCEEGAVNMDAIYSVGYDSVRKESLELKCGQGLIGASATTGKELIVSDVTVDDRYIEANPSTRSEIVVPIKLNDKVIGVINLESNERDAYRKRDLSLVTAFASQAAISLERARLHERNLEARKIEEQLKIARDIQRSFLPNVDPAVTGYDIAGRNTPSGEVGGDYYDFIRIVGSHWGVAIADVSGKGMPAALIMASFRASLIAEIRNNYSIRTICEKVNALLYESLEHGNYVTGVYGVLDSTNHIFTFSNFGHNPPVLLRANGEVEYLTEGGMILGINKDADFEEKALFINKGDIVIMYTDGVTEVFDSQGRELGRNGMIDVVREQRGGTARQIADAVEKAVFAFASPQHLFDDITLVVIKRQAG